MNSFLILRFFKEGLTKTVEVSIISLAKIFTNGKNTKKQVFRISLSFDVKMVKLKTKIIHDTATMIPFNKTPKSQHLSGKFSFSYKI